MKWIGILSLLAAGLMLTSGCAPMNKNECLEANWYQLGRQDGARGAASEYFARRVEACQEYGVQADRTAYYQGRDDGLRLFCTPENGYALGRKGTRYGYQCPPEMEKAFLARYNEGLEEYRFERKIQDLDKKIAYTEKAIEDYEEEMLAPKVPSAERYRLYREIKKLEQQKLDLVAERDFLVSEQSRNARDVFK